MVYLKFLKSSILWSEQFGFSYKYTLAIFNRIKKSSILHVTVEKFQTGMYAIPKAIYFIVAVRHQIFSPYETLLRFQQNARRKMGADLVKNSLLKRRILIDNIQFVNILFLKCWAKKGGGTMKSMNLMAKKCCSVEHERLIKRLERCDLRARTDADRHLCYTKAARRSGLRSQTCILSG
jgi:hypothetical protein